MTLIVFNNNSIIQWGKYAGSNNRWFIYPVALTKLFAINVTDLTPISFDTYTCTTYLWQDTDITKAHVISTSQHTPIGFIVIIGI